MLVNIKHDAMSKDIELGNMGMGSLKSHVDRAKHKAKLKARECHTFFHTVPSTSSVISFLS